MGIFNLFDHFNLFHTPDWKKTKIGFIHPVYILRRLTINQCLGHSNKAIYRFKN